MFIYGPRVARAMSADPLLAFHEDHERIRPRLRQLEKALDAAMNRDRAEVSERKVFREGREFLETAVLDHFRREEHALLPALEARVGRFGSLVNVIAYDHDEVRREVGKLAEALVALEAKADRPHVAELHEVNRHGIFLVQYLGLHMAKEDAYFGGDARQALGEGGLAEVTRRLEAVR